MLSANLFVCMMHCGQSALHF